MKRRDFVTLAAGAAFVLPFAAAAQPKTKRTIGILTQVQEPFWSVFREEMRKLGYIDGQNVAYELRFAEGKAELLPKLAGELVALKVDVIVASLTPAVFAAKAATKTIPIVMAPAGDPVGTGLVTSLARPGGNITGVSGTASESGSKLLQLFREIHPSIKAVAVMANAPDPFTKSLLAQLQQGSRALRIELKIFMLNGPADMDAAFAETAKAQITAVIVQPSLPRIQPIDLALKYKLASASPYSSFAEAGGLLSFSASPADLFGQPATYVDRLLRGAKAGDLPIQQPTRFELNINLKTAKAIGVVIPQSLLVRAEKVIQ